MQPYIMSLDQGTTSSRCIIFDRQGNIRSSAQKEFRQIFPQPGWVEHDAMEIWRTTLEVAKNAMEKLGAQATDIAAIGPVRSTRFMFSDIALHYDAIIAHAGGDKKVLNNAYNRGVDSFNIDTQNETAYSFRDMDRWHSGIWWEHCLFARGEGLYDKAVDKEIDIAQDPEKDYGLSFVRYGIPKEGESANSISVTFTSFGRKTTTMVYDEDLNQYIYHQYDQMMLDGLTGYPEAFQNVIIMLADIYMNQYGYHEANFLNGGTGYFACGGKLIPITWTCEAQDQPFRFFTEDGAPLNLQVGNTYMAIAPKESPVVWE